MKVCVKCQIELRPHENGIVALSMASFGAYELYEADVWHCPQCGWKGILDFAAKPFAQHHEPDFEQVLANVEVARTVVRFWQNAQQKSDA